MRLGDALLPGPDVQPINTMLNAIDQRAKSALELDMRDLFFALVPKFEIVRKRQSRMNPGTLAVMRSLLAQQ